MTQERKEPRFSEIDPGTGRERIPTLSDVVSSDLFDPVPPPEQAPRDTEEAHENEPEDAGQAVADTDESGPQLGDYDFVDELVNDPPPEEQAAETNPPAGPQISAEDIEALSDRVLDQVAPALREAVTAAVTELLSRKAPDRD